MEYYFLISILVVIFARSKLHKKITTWFAKAGYICSILVATVVLDISLHQGYNDAVYDAATPGTAVDKVALIPRLGELYGSGNPLLLLVILFVIVEVCAYFIPGTISFFDRKNDAGNRGLMSIWWANVIVFLVAPAIVFNVANYHPTSERGLDVVSSNLTPVLAVYGAPAYWLRLYMASDSTILAPNELHFSPRYPPTTMRDFGCDSLPWFLLCVFMTLVSCLNPYRRGNDYNLTQLFFGSLRLKERIQIYTLWLLPWRGKYLLAYFLCGAILAGFALLLQLLRYAGIAFFHGGFLLVIPALILWVFLAFKKK